MSAAIDFVGEVGDAIIFGDCRADGDVLMRSGGELLKDLLKNGLDCGDGDSILEIAIACVGEPSDRDEVRAWRLYSSRGY